MNILSNLTSYLDEFNKQHGTDLHIDTIRVLFSKQYKKTRLDKLGKWVKMNSQDRTILPRLRKMFKQDEVTSVYRLEDYSIYYYNSNIDKPKYRKAVMVIFGLKQYHKAPPPNHLVNEIVSILKDISQVDICLDMNKEPLYNELRKHFNFNLERYLNSYYINSTGILMLDRIIIYDKAYKNDLPYPLWRIEATISIPNAKVLAPPLYEFLKIINISKGNK
jgi:hypothetical protein